MFLQLKVERENIMLHPPNNLRRQHAAKAIKKINDLLKLMQNGLVIECHDGDISATRLCR